MRVILSMIREKAKASSFGRMEEYTMACGRTGNSMEKGHSLQRMAFKGLESGIEAENQSGLHD